ncbi:unnamed protein product [Symbiodinium natans]|uniref:Uncharacterized protein n=1 Tax=Symbiodinium natans TaxID=878477 RepID=A0A812UUZ5_9DINO|nr:unnamed protein product [Symbiodinium natans]
MGAASGVAAAPLSYLACETPCCDGHESLLVEHRQGTKIGFASFESPFTEIDDPKSPQGYSKMEIVCASDLDAYRINRWAKDDKDVKMSQGIATLEAFSADMSGMMPLAPPEGYLADSPDGQTVLDLGDTAEFLDLEGDGLAKLQTIQT